MSKMALDVARATRLVNHGPTILASCHYGGASNVVTLAWVTPASVSPPVLAIAVAPERYSHELIRRSGEFVVNVPGVNLLRAVWYCGTHSGRDGDKFAAAALTRGKATSVSAPLVKECFAHAECRVIGAPTVGDHTLFLGEVVAASAELGAFDGWLSLEPPFETLHHLGGTRFTTSGGAKLTAG